MMKHIKNKILISLFLLSTTNQVFAMDSKLPSLGNPATVLPSLSKAPISVSSLLISRRKKRRKSSRSAIPRKASTTPKTISTAPVAVSTTPVAVSTTTPTTISTVPAPTQGGAYIDQIKTLAADSTCANYSWKSRGKAPVGYISGVTLSYARSLCRLKTNSTLSKVISAASSGNTTKDALALYQSTFAGLSISVTTAGEDPLRAVYTLGMGLGMRESSGSYCEGWDRSAGSNRPSSAAEAGAFQTSYDSMGSSPELSKLYAEYKATPNRCFLDVFKQGASCGSTSILGSGAGAEYQAFNIACPAFATEYAMTMLRIQRGHYGPINRQEAEVVPACNQLLKSVQDLINNDPYACQDIN